jgi:hypothetical protein
MPRQPLRHTHRRASTNEQSLAASQDHLPVNHMGVGGSNRAVCSSKDSAGDDKSTFEAPLEGPVLSTASWI